MHPKDIDNGFYSSLMPQGLIDLEFYDETKSYNEDAVFLYDW